MQTLDEVMKGFNKKFNSDLAHYGLTEYDYERIPFTSPRLNYMTFGGLPVGKLVEFYGEQHSGKTTTSLDIVANYQASFDRKALWVDCERTFDNVWAHKLGVDVEELAFLQPEEQGAEDIFQFILDAISTGEIGLVVIDSLGVMVSNVEMYEKDLKEKTYAGISASLTKFCAKAVGLCAKHKCTVIGINQVRDDFNANPMFPTKKTTGGNGWKHNVIARFEFRMGDYIDENNKKLTRGAENPAGNKVQVVMRKNKTAPPTRRTGYYTLKYLDGIDALYDLIEVAMKFNIVKKSGAWFSIVNIDTGEVIEEKIHGQDKVQELLAEDKDILRTVVELIEARLYSDDTKLEDDIDIEEEV